MLVSAQLCTCFAVHLRSTGLSARELPLVVSAAVVLSSVPRDAMFVLDTDYKEEEWETAACRERQKERESCSHRGTVHD